jgi:anti-sigma28 factor (negative regulator of flagellin synthesis)
MSDINPIGRSGIPPMNSARPKRSAEPVNGHAQRNGQDAVELSDRARLLSKLHELPDIRQDLVDRVKTDIELDRYETDEKINAALNALLESGDLA